MRRNVILKAASILLVVWGCVWIVRTYAVSKKVTAELVNREVARLDFADWSNENVPPDVNESRRRDKSLREIADLVNRLDFQERERNRENRSGEAFFRKLTSKEKGLFIDLTIMESMGRFMEALDAMKPDQRKKFVEQGLKEVREGRTADEMSRADKLGGDLLDKVSEEGMRAYFDKATTDTKLDLAPLMQAMNEIMQGLRGNEFGPR